MSTLRTAKAGYRHPRIPEKAIQAQGVQLLRSLGGVVYVLGTVRPAGDYRGTCQTPGVPDVLCFLPHKGEPRRRLFLVWECKGAGGRLRPEQEAFQQLCREAEIVHVVGDFDALIAWLVEHTYLKPENVPHYRHPQEQPHGS